MGLYGFTFQDDLILVEADSERAAQCRAFLEVSQEYGVDPDRLQSMGWPAAGDYHEIPTGDGPIILEGQG